MLICDKNSGYFYVEFTYIGGIYMDSIISRIIEIDMVAGQRLEAAYKAEADIREQILRKNEQTTLAIEKKAEERIAKIDEIECQYAEEDIIKIDTDFALREEKLEQMYLDIHVKIEQDIFNNIISY